MAEKNPNAIRNIPFRIRAKMATERFKKAVLPGLAARRLRELREARSRSQARPRFVAFVEEIAPYFDRFDYLAPYADVLEAAVGGDLRVVFAAPPQHGKAIANETPMLTRAGWRRADQVQIGDELVGADGNWTRVVGVFPQGVVPLYRVRFTDGVSLATCGEHRWQVSQRYGYAPSVRTTAQLARDLTESDERCKWRIPVVATVKGEHAKLPIDPYLLGVWLGDGTSARGEITTMDEEIIQAFRDLGWATSYEYRRGRASTYGLPGLQRKLRDLKVLGNKHVPAQYLSASPAQRLALLQGLCDTDGTVARNGGQQSYCTTSEQLAQDFKFLVNSLGGVWTEYKKSAAAKIAHILSFRLPHGMAGFRLARKQSRLNLDSARSVPRRFVKSIEPIQEGGAVCFAVDADDHLFCAGRDLVVTHNSELSIRAFLYYARYFPGKRHAYVTYNQTRSQDVAKLFQRIAREAGFEVGGTLNIVEIGTGADRTTIKFTSIEGGLTGYAVDGLCLIDDPIKGPAEARSPTVRKACKDFWIAVGRARRHPGTSFIVMATRWHIDDLSGYLVKECGWRYINLKAIAEPKNADDTDTDGRIISDPLHRFPGESLWSKKPPEFFKEERTDRYWWASMYQGEPVPAGGSVFHAPGDIIEGKVVGPGWYRELPKAGYRVAFGLDLAYTAKTSADWSICIEGWAAPVDGRPKLFIVDVLRKQVEAPSFALSLKAKGSKYPGAYMRWYAAGTEKGSANFLQRQGLRIRVLPPLGDKFVRAGGAAACWNRGDILLPDPEVFPCEWFATFLDVVTNFTGVEDDHDDDVDALAALHDELMLRSALSGLGDRKWVGGGSTEAKA